jgi:hypothetical protein
MPTPDHAKRLRKERAAETRRRAAIIDAIAAADAPRIASQAAEAGKRYAEAQRTERRRVVTAAQAHASPVELVRLGRDVEAGAWRDPDDSNPNRRTAKMVQGHRRIDVLAGLHVNGNLVTAEHMRAAKRYRTAYEIGHEGARPAGAASGPVQETLQPGGPTLAQLDQMAVYREATAAVGPRLCAILIPVVLDNRDVSTWCKGRGPVDEAGRRTDLRRDVGMGMLVAALDRLCDHLLPVIDGERRANRNT